MAATDAGAALTAAHRVAQARLRTATVRDLLRAWSLFDPKAISTSWAALEPLLVALIQSRRPMSAALAAEYLDRFGLAEIGSAPSRVTIPQLAADEIVPNLRYLGPANALRLDQLARPSGDIARVTFSNIEGEVARQVLNGGRQTIVNTVQSDRRARGYSRVTDGAPCAFCAMLAGRGAVYNSEGSGSFEAHRKCGCTAEPTYWDDAPLSPSARQFADLYRQAARSAPAGADRSAAVRAEFRRLYEATTT